MSEGSLTSSPTTLFPLWHKELNVRGTADQALKFFLQGVHVGRGGEAVLLPVLSLPHLTHPLEVPELDQLGRDEGGLRAGLPDSCRSGN